MRIILVPTILSTKLEKMLNISKVNRGIIGKWNVYFFRI